MNDKNEYRQFDALAVPLQGSNLVEASAGTGKTYSIAILVLRLVLERELLVKEILMVTFTKAAVAELEERVRLFVRTAQKSAWGAGIKDDNIRELVARAIHQFGEDNVRQRLKNAVALLDELSVRTIHSFCQQTLNEYAFETDQLFGADMLPDMSAVIGDELNKFWRSHITTLDTMLLQQVWTDDMRDDIQGLVTEHLGGKKYLGYDEHADYTIAKSKQLEWLRLLNEAVSQQTKLEQALYAHAAENAAELKAACETNAYARKGLLPFLTNPETFIAKVKEKQDKAYVEKLFPGILQKIKEIDTAAASSGNIIAAIRVQLNCLAIKEIGEGLRNFKEKNNLLGYDDLVANLHRALSGSRAAALAAALQAKYKAVFIDEFQDTDRQQYEIFNRAFGGGTLLFYIGDPKQSIYAWRKADIFTYFKARRGVANRYSMNVNFRSSDAMVSAMNKFFLPAEGFDTFHFEDGDEAIHYIDVESPPKNSRAIWSGKKMAAPVTVFECTRKQELVDAAAAQTALLLQKDAYTLFEKDKHRAVLPSDIGILVRTGWQGRDLKAALARLGIPAVTIDDARVLQSDEALRVLYLLEAIADPRRSSINRALLSPFTGLSAADILLLDDEAVLTRFTKYKNKWQSDGIYTVLMDFVSDFGVRERLLRSHTENGERVITNLFQLAELVHQVESRRNLSTTELVSWLRRGIDGMQVEGDEYIQRVESDDESVKIVTIHKSKGLEYNIVLAPFLDFTVNEDRGFYSMRDPVSGDYIGAESERLSTEQLKWYARQAEQENRRLLYVAITRAVYKCYIFRNTYGRNKNSTLGLFLAALKANPPAPGLIAFETGLPAAPVESYRSALEPPPATPAQPVVFHLMEENWRRMSYTMLAGKPEPTLRARAFPKNDPYDEFVFSTLRRGAKTGNFLHFLFEKIHFNNESKWEYWLNEGIRRFVPGQQEVYLPMLQRLLNEVLNTVINISGQSFKLASVPWDKRIPEFEFDFPVSLFTPDTINSFSDKQVSILVKGPQELASELEGIMNGKMDLFFEYDGRYYVLDWKSNYLGPSTDDYSPAALAAAMNESNYHLQYLIYTMAAKKYLQSRIPGFDYTAQFGGVIYVFIRGVRAGSEHGIFTVKPPLEKIEALEEIIG